MNQMPFITQFSKMLTQSSPRFGVVSQHSFFSRHNPHPNRVRHIQGEMKYSEVTDVQQIELTYDQNYSL